MALSKFNAQDAKIHYGKPTDTYGALVPAYFMFPDSDLKYMPAYVVTNENLAHTTGLTKNVPHDNVLTIAGSGDQALFYKLSGAKNIDTFDISAFAKTISDIKVAALQSKMPYEQYNKMLNDLHRAPHHTQVNGMDMVLPNLSPDSIQTLKSMDGYKIFSNGLGTELHPSLTPTSYEQLQSQVQTPFPFIWSDAVNVHTKLDKQYDVINLSNIFEWAPKKIEPTLLNLRQHVRPGGFILVQTGPGLALDKNLEQYRTLSRRFRDWAKMYMDTTNKEEHVIMLQRQR